MPRGSHAKPILACYYPVGDDRFGTAIRDVYAQSGVDIMELGIPAVDAAMDGADIVASMQRSLAAGIDFNQALSEVAEWTSASSERPAGVLMAYGDADLDSLCPPDVLDRLEGMLILGLDDRPDCAMIRALAQRHDVPVAGFVPAHFTDLDLERARAATGYVMLQAVSGSTGPRPDVDRGNAAKIRTLRAEGITAPILLGFGISTAEQARESIDLGADGVVIGSMCVRTGLMGTDALADFLGGVRSRLDD